jgi:hypothetical protein
VTRPMRAAVAIAAFLILVGIGLLILVLSGLLFALIVLLGIVVFAGVLAGFVVAVVLLIVAVPYYLVAKPAETVPGHYRLEQVKGK